MEPTPDQRALASHILNLAHKNEMDAVYGGEMGDRGASALRAKVNAWIAGLEGRVLPGWEATFAQLQRESQKENQKKQDPEYAEYIKLQQKFKQ